MAQVKFLIRPDGTIEEQVLREKGKACLSLTQSLEKALGKVVGRQYTSEFYDQPGQTVLRSRKQKHIS